MKSCGLKAILRTNFQIDHVEKKIFKLADIIQRFGKVSGWTKMTIGEHDSLRWNVAREIWKPDHLSRGNLVDERSKFEKTGSALFAPKRLSRGSI